VKLLFACHGFPPEQRGGVELAVAELAFSLSGRGHRISVLCASLERSAEPERATLQRSQLQGPDGERIELWRLSRPDLYFDHWHKSLSQAASSAFREVLREVRPDVVHVHHWLRLSRDLVCVAAREGFPTVLTLHDAFASCPIVFRVRSDTRLSCDAPVGPHPCIACAGRIAPRTPWVSNEAAFLLLAERQRDLARELELARVLIAPSLAHARALERDLGRAEGSLAIEVIAPRARLGAPHSAQQPLPEARRLRLVSWSQLARHKGVDVLLDAFLAARSALAGRIELELAIHCATADAAFAAELQRKSEGHPVHWGGGFTPEELRARVDPRAAVFVSATRAHESYGVSVDEAAELGLALLLPDAPVFRERCGPAAVFFRSGDSASLCTEIVRLAEDARLVAHHQDAARQWSMGLATRDELAERHEAAYARALRAGAPQVQAAAWFEARLATQSTLEWDRALSQRSAAELGL
jgi:glycosyltransferase involved in cell wall biosynthesis